MYPILIDIIELTFQFLPFPLFLALSIAVDVVVVFVIGFAGNMILVPL